MVRPRTTADSSKTKVLVVDDHPIVREGITRLIDREPDLSVCGFSEDATGALQAVARLKPDIAILDISLKNSNGLELARTLKSQYPKLPLLMLSMYHESLYAERALRAGAKGYIVKQEAPEKLITAVRRVLTGQIYLSDEMSAKILNKITNPMKVTASPVDSLSDRELEVFRLIGQGHGTSEIAEKLYVSVKTVETYRSHIKEKLNLLNASQLLRYAIQWVNSQPK